MASATAQLRILRFAEFEVDLRTGELFRDGAKLKFGGQPMQILSILLERPGELITREELQRRLWPDTFVDVDHNLNTAINKIRDVLGDSAERPRFIETLPRRGYRFIGALESPSQPASVAAVTASRAGDALSRRWFGVGLGVLALFLVSLVAVIALRGRQQRRPDEQTTLNAVPFTALPGSANSPAFSPDGSRIALAWDGYPKERSKGFDLYVKALGSETLLRLTQHPSEWVSPVWSPDGTQIAFHRMDGVNTGIYVVPALGGPERKLNSTRIRVNDLAPISWSPDGKWIAYADVQPPEEATRIYLLSTETLDAKQLSANSACLAAGQPAFSHNGESLAYWCLRTAFDAVLYSVPLRGGREKAIASFPAFPKGLAWSVDDERLVYSLRLLRARSDYELGEVAVKGGSAKQFAVAMSASQPTVSPQGDKLAFSAVSTRSNLWRKDLFHPESPDVELFPSSRAQFDAQYSPDGKRIAFASLRSGVQAVWVGSSDGTDLVQISSPNYVSGSPQWSPDGSRIAFDAHPGEEWEIYEADVTERKPRKLMTTVTNVVRPSWSRDGKWIYFSSQRSGKMGVYRCPVSGGEAVLLGTGTEDINPQEAFNGSEVYFASNHDKSTLKHIALTARPGAESKVDGLPRIKMAELWTLSRSGIYFVPAEAPRSLSYYDFAKKRVRSMLDVERDFTKGISLSPDNRWILYSLEDDPHSDIMLVDHFN